MWRRSFVAVEILACQGLRGWCVCVCACVPFVLQPIEGAERCECAGQMIRAETQLGFSARAFEPGAAIVAEVESDEDGDGIEVFVSRPDARGNMPTDHPFYAGEAPVHVGFHARQRLSQEYAAHHEHKMHPRPSSAPSASPDGGALRDQEESPVRTARRHRWEQRDHVPPSEAVVPGRARPDDASRERRPRAAKPALKKTSKKRVTKPATRKIYHQGIWMVVPNSNAAPRKTVRRAVTRRRRDGIAAPQRTKPAPKRRPPPSRPAWDDSPLLEGTKATPEPPSRQRLPKKLAPDARARPASPLEVLEVEPLDTTVDTTVDATVDTTVDGEDALRESVGGMSSLNQSINLGASMRSVASDRGTTMSLGHSVTFQDDVEPSSRPRRRRPRRRPAPTPRTAVGVNNTGIAGPLAHALPYTPSNAAANAARLATKHVKTLDTKVMRMIRRAMEHKRSLYGHTIEHSHDLFRAMDRDGSGTLEPAEIRQGLDRLDLGLGPDQMNDLIERWDKNDDGSVSYGELVDALHGNLRSTRRAATNDLSIDTNDSSESEAGTSCSDADTASHRRPKKRSPASSDRSSRRKRSPASSRRGTPASLAASRRGTPASSAASRRGTPTSRRGTPASRPASVRSSAPSRKKSPTQDAPPSPVTKAFVKAKREVENIVEQQRAALEAQANAAFDEILSHEERHRRGEATFDHRRHAESIKARLRPLTREADILIEESVKRAKKAQTIQNHKFTLHLARKSAAVVGDNIDKIVDMVTEDILADTVGALGQHEDAQARRVVAEEHPVIIAEALAELARLEKKEDAIRQKVVSRLMYEVDSPYLHHEHALGHGLHLQGGPGQDPGFVDLKGAAGPGGIFDHGETVHVDAATGKPVKGYVPTAPGKCAMTWRDAQGIEENRDDFLEHVYLKEAALSETGHSQHELIELLERDLVTDMLHEMAQEFDEILGEAAETLMKSA